MAGCERGYLCTVCGREVEEITESDLYLRYVLGEAEWDELNRAPERHIRCNPVLAQFIVDTSFEPVSMCRCVFKDSSGSRVRQERRKSRDDGVSQIARACRLKMCQLRTILCPM